MGARTFQTEQHCGAATDDGKPCTHTKGFRTPHPGNGKCFLHGGCSTGPKTMAGKAKVSQNARRSGLYAKSLSGTEAVRFQAVQDFAPSEILQENFYLVQSKVLGILEGEGTFSKDAKTLLSACEILVEGGEIQPEFVEDLRLRLLNLDIERLSRILNSTVNLVNASVFLDRMGDMKAQLALLKGFLVNTIKLTQERAIRELAVQTLAEMKLEAGLPTEELERLLIDTATAIEEEEALSDALDAGDNGAPSEHDSTMPIALDLDDFDPSDDPWNDAALDDDDPWNDALLDSTEDPLTADLTPLMPPEEDEDDYEN